LNRNPAKRLGSNSADASEIKAHEFFAEIEWDKVERREYPVMVPKVKSYTANPKSV
jgi:protein-serine/threonine kinase